jgi:hypothetical protein
MREYEQQGIKFIDLELNEHPNITVTLDGMPFVLVRDNPTSPAVNVLTVPGAEFVHLMRNNRDVNG